MSDDEINHDEVRRLYRAFMVSVEPSQDGLAHALAAIEWVIAALLANYPKSSEAGLIAGIMADVTAMMPKTREQIESLRALPRVTTFSKKGQA